MSLLLDLTHTSHTAARTGIQRTARALCRELGSAVQPICHDPFRKAWRPLEAWEIANLKDRPPAAKRGTRWPLHARLRGWLARVTCGPDSGVSREILDLTGPTSFLCPELFSPGVAAALPQIFARVSGPRAAIFYDAIALAYPEFAAAKTVARFPSYLQELLAFDGIAAISEESRDALLDYWRWLGVRKTPPVIALPLGADPPPPSVPVPRSLPSLLYVASIEGRKNHLALLDACDRLWQGGSRFELRLIGLAHPQTGKPALEKIAALIQAGRPVRYDGAVDEKTLEAAYAEASFTVYVSLAEGYGLPVSESLARGKACVCSSHGAVGEAARGGGCIMLDTLNASNLATAIGGLLAAPQQVAALSAAARARALRTWADCARDVTGWLQSLTRRC